jgi:hypothetical protein
LVVTYLAVPAALAGSDLVATVPRRVAELIAATARVAVTPLPIDFALTVSMAWHRRAATDPAQSWFRSRPQPRDGPRARGSRVFPRTIDWRIEAGQRIVPSRTGGPENERKRHCNPG